MKEKKYIYIFSNSAMPKIIKIGRTDKHPELRSEQLSKQTGSIGHFVCEWYKEVADNYLAEIFLHYIFRKYHYNKEYFKLKTEKAIELANHAIEDFEKVILKYDYSIDVKDLEDTIGGLKLLVDDKKIKQEVMVTINDFNEKIRIIKELEQ